MSMSSSSSHRGRFDSIYCEVCIGNIGNHTKAETILKYFSNYGRIIQHNFSNPNTQSGILFITYAEKSMADNCMNSRPHYVDNRRLYVKRTLPIDKEHPRDHIESSTCLMVLLDFSEDVHDDPAFLSALADYFSSYGKILSCKYSREKNFDYVLIQFDDRDQVDQAILDKPHFYKEHTLQVMKHIPDNIDSMNARYSRPRTDRAYVPEMPRIQSASSRAISSLPNPREPIDEMYLQGEVFRLQECVKEMNADFARQRQQLKEQYSEKLHTLNEQTETTRRLQHDVDKNYTELLREYEEIKQENEALNEQYLGAELENFEITSYYEQVLAEEKAKTARLEAERTGNTRSSSSTHPGGTHSARSTRTN